jgi:hypothetical protein
MYKAIGYSEWRLMMWMDGYGTYQDIDWAVQKKLLSYPITNPRFRELIKFIIRIHHYFEYRRYRE